MPSPTPIQIDLLNSLRVARTTIQTQVRNSRGSLLSAAGNQLNRMTKAASVSASSSTISSLSDVLVYLLPTGYAKTTCACHSYLILKRPKIQYFLNSRAHVVVFRLQNHIRVYGSALNDFLNLMDPNDFDLCVPKEIPPVS